MRLLLNQQELQKYSGEHLTRPEAATLLPKDFSSLIFDPSKLGGLEKFMATDLIFLVKALLLMPNARKFVISDSRWRNSHERRWTDCAQMSSRCFQQVSFSINPGSRNDRDEVLLDPRPWPNYPTPISHSRNWYRGFFVLAQAASMLNTKVQSFSVEAEGYSFNSGISHTVFLMSAPELRHTCNAFQYLTDIKLVISTRDTKEHIQWCHVIKSGSLGKALGAASGLNHLHLEFLNLSNFSDHTPDSIRIYMANLGPLFGHNTWPNLTKIYLGNMILHEDHIVGFLIKHAIPLRSLTLQDINLQPDDGSCFEVDPGEQWKSWSTALFRLQDLNLTHLAMHGHRMYVLGLLQKSWVADDAAEIWEFLQSGGMRIR